MVNHNNWWEWRGKLQRQQALFFNVALIAGENDRRRAEAAMIFANKPPCNTEYRDSFPFDTTEILVTGKSDLMKAKVIAYRTEGEPASVFTRRW
jgi:hypothetical protein